MQVMQEHLPARPSGQPSCSNSFQTNLSGEIWQTRLIDRPPMHSNSYGTSEQVLWGSLASKGVKGVRSFRIALLLSFYDPTYTNLWGLAIEGVHLR